MKLTKETNLYRDHAVKNGVDDAAKVATNYLDYDQQTGVTVGYIGTSERAVIASDGMEIYDGLNNQIAQFKSVTRLGLENEGNLQIDYHSLQLKDLAGETYVHLSDSRGHDGYTEFTETFTGNGTRNYVYVDYAINSVISVTINGTETSDYTYNTGSRYLYFTTAPQDGSEIIVNYKSAVIFRAYTFGTRNPDYRIGSDSFVNGYECVANGDYSHAEGKSSFAMAESSHAEGDGCTAQWTFSRPGAHAEGSQTMANGTGAHSEGYNTRASSNYAHAEGYETEVIYNAAHAEGYQTKAYSSYTHAEGYQTEVHANCSHVEGKNCLVEDYYASASHAEGCECKIQKNYTASSLETKGEHVEGYKCTIQRTSLDVNGAHAEGYECLIKDGNGAHAEGRSCTIESGIGAHAEGLGCTVKSGAGAHAEGYRTTAKGDGQHVCGEYNVETTTPIFIVGGGTFGVASKNALTLNKNGNMTIAGTLTQQSDKRLKHHRAYLSDQQNEVNEFINRLKPVWFEKDEQKHLGFYAQDVQQTDRWQCMIDTDTNGYLTLGYTEIIAPLVAYCQNLEQKVDALEERIARLEQLLNL